MADALIESLSEQEFTPGRYRDTHRDALTALIDAKATGRPAARGPEGEAASLDLLAALKASVEAAKQRSTTANGSRKRKPARTVAAPTPQKTRKTASQQRKKFRHASASSNTPRKCRPGAARAATNDCMSADADYGTDIDRCRGTLISHRDAALDCGGRLRTR